MSDPRAGLRPDQPSGNDAYDKMTGKGIYYVHPPAPSASSPPSPPPPAPPPPPPPKPVKIPERSLVNLSTEGPSTSLISTMLFDMFSSVEVATISRRNTIEGQNPFFSLISNLATIRRSFDPTRLITNQRTINQNFNIHLINLYEKIPDDEYLAQNNLTNFYYIDTNGDLVIEVDNLEVDEIIDIEIANSGTINLVDES